MQNTVQAVFDHQPRPRLIFGAGVVARVGELARELGARAFVRKPIDVDALRAAVRRISCPHARAPRPTRTPAAARATVREAADGERGVCEGAGGRTPIANR